MRKQGGRHRQGGGHGGSGRKCQNKYLFHEHDHYHDNDDHGNDDYDNDDNDDHVFAAEVPCCNCFPGHS